MEQNVSEGERVGIFTGNTPETVIGHLATLKLGAISVPLSSRFGPKAVTHRLKDSSTTACFVNGENIETLRTVKSDLEALELTLATDEINTLPDEAPFSNVIETQSPDFENATTYPDTEAIIAYTSGTTGDPKGVVYTHDNLLGYLPGILPCLFNLEINESDITWSPVEMAWAPVLMGVIFASMFYSVPTIIYNRGPFDPKEAFSVIDEFSVSIFYSTPTALRMMKEISDSMNEYDLSSMRSILSGGEEVGKDLYDWANKTFDGVAMHQGYAQTEFNPICSECFALDVRKLGTIGKPLPGRKVKIVDPDTGEYIDEPNQTGELAVYTKDTPACFKEYWKNPKKTEQKFDGDWLLTEDIVSQDEDGYYKFESRKDWVIISSGYRIGPEEIEDTLVQHETVREAGVTSTEHDTRGQVPKAHVVIEGAYEETEELQDELQMFVKESLGEYQYPREIVFRDELPKTSNLKIKRSALE